MASYNDFVRDETRAMPYSEPIFTGQRRTSGHSIPTKPIAMMSLNLIILHAPVGYTMRLATLEKECEFAGVLKLGPPCLQHNAWIVSGLNRHLAIWHVVAGKFPVSSRLDT